MQQHRRVRPVCVLPAGQVAEQPAGLADISLPEDCAQPGQHLPAEVRPRLCLMSAAACRCSRCHHGFPAGTRLVHAKRIGGLKAGMQAALLSHHQRTTSVCQRQTTGYILRVRFQDKLFQPKRHPHAMAPRQLAMGLRAGTAQTSWTLRARTRTTPSTPLLSRTSSAPAACSKRLHELLESVSITCMQVRRVGMHVYPFWRLQGHCKGTTSPTVVLTL